MDDGFDDALDDLLVWLDPDREIAGDKYETIRAGLIKVFIAKGFSDPEDLTDITIDRVKRKLPEIKDTYEGEKANYFHGVARNVIREALRRREIATDKIPEQVTLPDFKDDRYECLLRCLGLTPARNRELILDYYLYVGKDKIEHHRLMAEELGISPGALRTRAHHIRRDLEACVLQCVGSLESKQKSTLEALLQRQPSTGTRGKERQP